MENGRGMYRYRDAPVNIRSAIIMEDGKAFPVVLCLYGPDRAGLVTAVYLLTQNINY